MQTLDPHAVSEGSAFRTWQDAQRPAIELHETATHEMQEWNAFGQIHPHLGEFPTYWVRVSAIMDSSEAVALWILFVSLL
jgi:hypothetical protein